MTIDMYFLDRITFCTSHLKTNTLKLVYLFNEYCHNNKNGNQRNDHTSIGGFKEKNRNMNVNWAWVPDITIYHTNLQKERITEERRKNNRRKKKENKVGSIVLKMQEIEENNKRNLDKKTKNIVLLCIFYQSSIRQYDLFPFFAKTKYTIILDGVCSLYSANPHLCGKWVTIISMNLY